MDYLMLCPVCATPCTDRFEDKCSGCGSKRDPIFVCTTLARAVEMLIKMGIGVTGTDLRYYTTHKSVITINLAGNLPEYLFDELPDKWQLKCCGYYSYGRKFNLVCESYPENDNDANLDKYATMACKLEGWLADKDADVFKAVLILGGYATVQ